MILSIVEPRYLDILHSCMILLAVNPACAKQNARKQFCVMIQMHEKQAANCKKIREPLGYYADKKLEKLKNLLK